LTETLDNGYAKDWEGAEGAKSACHDAQMAFIRIKKVI